MKKITTLVILAASGLATQAQPNGSPEPLLDRGFYYDLLHITMTLLGFVLLAIFIYVVLKQFLDNRIKNKLIEKGASETIVTQLLQPTIKDDRNANVKWVCILAALGAGLTLINLFRPVGLHSLAMLCFCLAAGFLAYHIFIRHSQS